MLPLLLSLCSPGAFAAPDHPNGSNAEPVEVSWDQALLQELLALPNHGARAGRLTQELGARSADPDAIVRISDAITVVNGLRLTERNGDDDVQRFLIAALSESPELRAEAVANAPVAGPVPTLLGEVIEVEEEQDFDDIDEEVDFEPAIDDDETPAPTGNAALQVDLTVSIDRYRARQLFIRDVDESWRVYDGNGRWYRAVDFADRVEYMGRRADIESRQQRALNTGAALTAAGTVSAGVGTAVLISGAQRDSVVLLAGGGAATGLGATLLGAGIGSIAQRFGRLRRVETYWDRPEAQSDLTSYNDGVREELLLTPEDLAQPERD